MDLPTGWVSAGALAREGQAPGTLGGMQRRAVRYREVVNRLQGALLKEVEAVEGTVREAERLHEAKRRMVAAVEKVERLDALRGAAAGALALQGAVGEMARDFVVEFRQKWDCVPGSALYEEHALHDDGPGLVIRRQEQERARRLQEDLRRYEKLPAKARVAAEALVSAAEKYENAVGELSRMENEVETLDLRALDTVEVAERITNAAWAQVQEVRAERRVK